MSDDVRTGGERCRWCDGLDTRRPDIACPQNSTGHVCVTWSEALASEWRMVVAGVDEVSAERAAHAVTRQKLGRLTADAGEVLLWLNEASGRCPCCRNEEDHDPDMPCGKLWATPEMGGPAK